MWVDISLFDKHNSSSLWWTQVIGGMSICEYIQWPSALEMDQVACRVCIEFTLTIIHSVFTFN